jgi:hypothetical protein
VALSTFNVFFGAKNAYKAALDWHRQLSWVLEFRKTLPPEQFMDVRYEDLLQRPRETFADVIAFLKISDPGNALLDFVTGRIGEDLRADNADKWRTQLTARQCAVFEAVAADELQAFGYPIVSPRRLRLGILSRACYQCDNKLRKWMNVEYQQDNVYKIKLRLRKYSQPVRRVLALATGRTSLDTRAAQ